MARGRSVIVGGGVQSQTPFTEGQFSVIVNDDPATIAAGNMRQNGDVPPKVFIGDSTYTAGATVIAATLNTNARDSIIIGQGASWLSSSLVGATGVVIGADTVLSGSSGGGIVVIGSNITSTSGFGNAVIIGSGTTTGAAGGTGNSSVLIGPSVSLTAGSNVVAIGASVTVSQSEIVCIGSGASATGLQSTVIGEAASSTGSSGVAIGNAASITHFSAMVLGVAVSSAANNSVVIGHSNGYNLVVIGGNGASNAAPTATITWRGTNGNGANLVGSAIVLSTGLGTGTGASSNIDLQVGIPVGAGSGQHTAQTGLRVSRSVVAADTWLMVFDVDNATLERVSVGAADSGGVGFKLLRIPN